MALRLSIPTLPLLGCLLGGLLSGCSGHPPEILRAEMLPLFLRDAAGRGLAEYAAAFVLVEDQDGWEDLETLYVINDEQRLFWTLAGRDLERKKKGNELWLGSSSLAMPDRSSLPRGYYRLQVRDFSGRRHETSVFFSPPAARPADAGLPADGSPPAEGRGWTFIFYRADGEPAGEIAPRSAQPAPPPPGPAARTAPAPAPGPPAGSAVFYAFKLEAGGRVGLAGGPWLVSEYSPGDR